jgi:hypothetical protein
MFAIKVAEQEKSEEARKNEKGGKVSLDELRTIDCE